MATSTQTGLIIKLYRREKFSVLTFSNKIKLQTGKLLFCLLNANTHMSFIFLASYIYFFFFSSYFLPHVNTIRRRRVCTVEGFLKESEGGVFAFTARDTKMA